MALHLTYDLLHEHSGHHGEEESESQSLAQSCERSAQNEYHKFQGDYLVHDFPSEDDDMRHLRPLKSLQLETLEGAVRKSSLRFWWKAKKELVGHCPQSVVKEILPTKEEALQDAVEHSGVQPEGYAVFLSFRGEDTRNSFDSPYDAFSKKGIHIFIDKEELHRGQKISEIFNETKESNVSLFVLPKNLAALEAKVQSIKLSLGNGPKVSPMLDVTAKNLGGFTTLDIPEIPPAGQKTVTEVRNVFQKAEPLRGKDLVDQGPPIKQNNDISIKIEKPRRRPSRLQSARSGPLISKISQYNATLLLAATLLATITYHIALRFPVELTEEIRPNESSSIIQTGKQTAELSSSHLLVFLNSIVFFTSVALITILTYDLHLNPWLLILVLSAFGAYVCIIMVNSPRDVVAVLFIGTSILSAAFLNCLTLHTKVLTCF